MKDDDNKELKPVYIHEAGYFTRDEISLVDISLVLVRNKSLFYIVFLLVLLIGSAVALYLPEKFSYTSTIEIGHQVENGKARQLEPSSTLLAKLEHGYISQVILDYRKTNPDDDEKYEIIASEPESNSSILLLQTEGTEDQEEILIDFLASITQYAIDDHNRIYLSVKNDLESRLKQANTNLNLLRKSNNNETEVASYQNIVESLSSQLSNLTNTRVATQPIKSLEPVSTESSVIVLTSAFVGLVLGIFVVFITEFISKIKEKQRLSS